MIPKIIHYCWFGSNELPEIAIKCIASWKKYMPDHKLMLWNEENSPMEHPYMKKAYQEKKWANLSNYTRLFAIEKMGGWYFDTDIELFKTPNFSNFKEECFLGLETKPHETPFYVNNAVIAAIPNHPFISQCFRKINEQYDGSELANLSSPVLTTNELKELGFKGKPCALSSVRIFPYTVFYPSSWYEVFERSMLTKNTICVHYNDLSWFSETDMTKKELIDLIKNNFKYRNDYIKYSNANVTIIEYLKFNIKYFGRILGVY